MPAITGMPTTKWMPATTGTPKIEESKQAKVCR
jgi:hypothetical protein